MITITMIFIIAVLVLANITITLFEEKNSSKNNDWTPYTGKIIIEKNGVETKNELITNEEHFYNNGKIIANEQKIRLLNKRIEQIEKVLSELVKQRMTEEETIDYEKIDFRIKVLEKELDHIKNPKPKQKTFFGKENDKMEQTIKALAFNSSRK